MKTLMTTTLAAALSIAAFSPAIAGEQSTIVVESESAMQAWQKDVGRSLDRRLATATKQTRIDPVSGIVQLRFTLDGSGKPRDISVLNGSGDTRTDFVAKRAVRGLTQLANAPVANASEQTFQANIVFADDKATYSKLAKALAASENIRMAQADSEGGVISFGL
uniref:energy transducer TonB family protein n=1 Tax=uncultured Altererythrobacter sp. TaxID=500840 RepID=UPI00260F75B8|nr:energy transducer TonB [uncultured Altererythrobacter sp.]